MQLLEPTTLTTLSSVLYWVLRLNLMAAFAKSPGIPEIFASLDYITSQTVLDMVVRNAIVHEKRHQRRFRYITLAPNLQWLLGFHWENQLYNETCLPFGLPTAPLYPDFFAECFHLILQSYLNWDSSPTISTALFV
jgi:hypothetical protein